MDAEIGAVATEAGKAIIQAMTSDAWNSLRPRLIRIFKRGGADNLSTALESDRLALQKLQLDPGTASGRWEVRIENLLINNPNLMDDLRDLLSDIGRVTPSTGISIQQTATGGRGSNIAAGRDVIDSSKKTTKSTNFGGITIAVVALGIVALLGGGAVVANNLIQSIENGGESGITADTLCGDYLRAPASERDQAVHSIAVDQGVSGAGSPFLRLNVDDQCGQQLNIQLGVVVSRQQY